MAVFRVRFFEGLHAVHHAHSGDARRIGKHVLHPGVARTADINEHVGFVNRFGVRGRRLVGVGIHTGTDEQREGGIAAQHLPGEVVAGKIRGDHAEGLSPAFRAGGARSEQQAEREEKRSVFAHGVHHSNLKSNFIFIV